MFFQIVVRREKRNDEKNRHTEQKQMRVDFSESSHAFKAVPFCELPVKNASRHGGYCIDKRNVQILFHFNTSFHDLKCS